MGKWMFFFVLLLVFQIGLISAEENVSITGRAMLSASITIVVNVAPSLNLLSPSNGTYLAGQNINLNYTSLSADYVWYNIDNGINHSLSGNIQFNVTEGSHTLSIYANNSHGVSSKSVVFNVNTSILIIDYDGFKGPGSEGSTDFLDYTFEELSGLSEITLVNTNYGQIYFTESINLFNDENSSDGLVNISKNVFISDKSIEIKTDALPNFNKSATLSFYNLAFSNPRILMNGEVCPSTICTIFSYSGGTLHFNVTHFTVYSVEETPSGGTSPGGGGGGGGTGPVLKSNFEVNPSYIPVGLSSGEIFRSYFLLTNTGEKDLPIEIGFENLGGRASVSEQNFLLERGEIKSLILSISAEGLTKGDFYFGKIIVLSGELRREILVSVEVSEKQSLFDVKLTIPPESQRVVKGGEVTGGIELYNFGKTRRVDIFLHYSILDEDGISILSQNETVAVETSLNLVRKFALPPEAPPGRYVLYVRGDYDGKMAFASSEFKVVKYKISYSEKVYIVLIIFLVVVISLIIYFFLKKKGEQAGKK